MAASERARSNGPQARSDLAPQPKKEIRGIRLIRRIRFPIRQWCQPQERHQSSLRRCRRAFTNDMMLPSHPRRSRPRLSF